MKKVHPFLCGLVFSLLILLSINQYANAQIAVVLQPPSNLTAQAISSSKINLSWTASSSLLLTGYKIERSTDGSYTWSTIVAYTGNTATTYSNTGLASGTTYTYRVSAINSVGTSSPSNIASATTNTPTSSINKVQSGLAASDPLNNETK